MADRELIGPVPQSTQANSAASSYVRAFPYDLLKEASRRLGIMALVGALLWISATALYHVVYSEMESDLPPMAERVVDAIAIGAAAGSLALYWYTRKPDRDPRRILNLGLGFLVLNAMALGLTGHWTGGPLAKSTTPMISWIGAVVLMSAAIVPNSPRKTLIAGLIAASMNPLGMLVARQGGLNLNAVGSALAMHYPDYMLVGVSMVIAHVLTRLGQQVSKAREMGSYRLLTMLGKGGMGEVWRARHRMLARDAAIKLIQPEMLHMHAGANASLLYRRFEQEARTTASLRSPHTVQLYDFGVTDNGVFYYAMELLEGIDLETLVRRFGSQPPERVVFLLQQVCMSLSEAHDHAMIHRDIKPTNIFLCRMGNEYDFVKVLDFGLVKVQREQDAMMTRAGSPTGTPAYMAPEVALGKAGIDGRADIYGLGCVAYWLLTGKPVFEENGAAATMIAHINNIPLPPSKRNGVSVPAALDEAIMLCLAKEPQKRPTAKSLLRMLAQIDSGSVWTSQNAENWWRVHGPKNVVPSDDQSEAVTIAPSIFTTM